MANTEANKERIFQCLMVLEKLEMNKAAASRQLGIHRNTLNNYFKKYWDEYEKQKVTIIPKVQEVEAKRLVLAHDLDEQRIAITEDIDIARQLMRERLENPELRKKISNRDLIRFIEILTPYVAEKKVALGVNPGDNPAKISHTTFVQNITQKIKQIKLQNNGKDKD